MIEKRLKEYERLGRLWPECECDTCIHDVDEKNQVTIDGWTRCEYCAEVSLQWISNRKSEAIERSRDASELCRAITDLVAEVRALQNQEKQNRRGVSVSPLRMWGAPCAEGTRIPTWLIHDMHTMGGESIENLAALYEISEDLVRDAIWFEKGLRSGGFISEDET